jgi:hypothetical protein
MTSRSRKTGSNEARRDNSRAASWRHLGYPDWNRRPLDPQDCGLGVLAGQSGSGGGAVGVPRCRLSGWVHGVWSPSGPQGSRDRTAADPSLVRHARAVGNHRRPRHVPLSQSDEVGCRPTSLWSEMVVSHALRRLDSDRLPTRCGSPVWPSVGLILRDVKGSPLG